MEKRKVKNGNVYIVEAHLQKFEGQLPYFSITHETWKANKKGEIDKRYKEPWRCGDCGGDVKKAFPELKDLFDYHLRDINGEPMYTIENTMYYIKSGMVDAVKHQLLIDDVGDIMKIKTKEDLQEYLNKNNLYAKWKNQAETLIEKYNLK